MERKAYYYQRNDLNGKYYRITCLAVTVYPFPEIDGVIITGIDEITKSEYYNQPDRYTGHVCADTDYDVMYWLRSKIRFRGKNKIPNIHITSEL